MKHRILYTVGFLLFSSTAVFAQGTIINSTFYSDALEESVPVQVYLPENYDPEGSYPVVYYLHGAFSWYNDWPEIIPILDNLILNQTIQPVIFVQPDGNAGSFGGSAWVNSELYGAFEDYIVQDLTYYIETTYTGASSLPTKRAIMGISMGGQGAMHTALVHPDFYCAVASMSGVLDYNSFVSWVPIVNAAAGGHPPYTYNPNASIFTDVLYLYSGAHSWNLSNPPYFVDFLLGSDGNIRLDVMERWLTFDPSTIAATVPINTTLKIYFDCGTSDEFLFYPFNVAFAAALDAHGLEYEFQSFSGGHVNHLLERIPVALQFIDDAFSTAITEVEADVVPPLSATLLPPYPNPFNPRTTLNFTLPSTGQATLAIYDARGMGVARLVDEALAAGAYTVDWTGADAFGRSLPSGTYFCRLTTNWGVETRKLQLVR